MSTITQMAKRLQKYGRNGDSVLVHMQPREIKALENAAGHRLTVNPATGLPEAFSLWKLLAGIGATVAAPFTGGTSLAALAPILGATGAALATSAFTGKKKSEDPAEESAARKYINDQAQKAKENYRIPWMEIGQRPTTPPGYLAGVSPEQNLMPIRRPVGWISPGGQVSAPPPGYAEGGMIPEQEEAAAVMQAVTSGNFDEATLNRFIEIFGEEMLDQVIGQQPQQQAAQGGLLRGPGGGMDDLIPAKVQGKIPVALSGGEYVVPGDATAALGDGSNEAGGRVLDAMVARIRKSKTGTTQQPGKINFGKVLPI